MAAGDLLAAQPSSSMQEVADVAGVHRATVHRHFPSRDDLISAVYGRQFEEAIAIVSDPLLQEGPARDALRRMTRATVAAGDRWRSYRYARAFDPIIEDRQTMLTEPVVALLGRGQHEGVVRHDLPPDQLIRVWGGLVYMFLPQVARGAMTVDSVTDLVMTVLGPAA